MAQAWVLDNGRLGTWRRNGVVGSQSDCLGDGQP